VLLRSLVLIARCELRTSTLKIADSAIQAHADATGTQRSKMLIPHAYMREIRHQAEDIQQPDDHEDHHNAIQNGFDCPLHGDQIDEPQKDPHYD
jgi:hypothetical protein